MVFAGVLTAHSKLTTSPGAPMSITDCDYLPNPAKAKFPPALALLIVRKAASFADALEQQALD